MGRISQRKAAKFYHIPQATISDYIRGKVSDGASAGQKPVLSIEFEQIIVAK